MWHSRRRLCEVAQPKLLSPSISRRQATTTFNDSRLERALFEGARRRQECLCHTSIEASPSIHTAQISLDHYDHHSFFGSKYVNPVKNSHRVLVEVSPRLKPISSTSLGVTA